MNGKAIDEDDPEPRMELIENKRPDGKNTWTLRQNEAMRNIRRKKPLWPDGYQQKATPKIDLSESEEIFVQDLDAHNAAQKNRATKT